MGTRSWPAATKRAISSMAPGAALAPFAGVTPAVTFHGTVLVYSLADPARPARTATFRGLALAPDGHTLTVVVDRGEMSATISRQAAPFTERYRPHLGPWHSAGPAGRV